jgi:hypothetical protein
LDGAKLGGIQALVLYRVSRLPGVVTKAFLYFEESAVSPELIHVFDADHRDIRHQFEKFKHSENVCTGLH